MVKKVTKTLGRDRVSFPQLCPSFEPFLLLPAAHKLTLLLGMCLRFTCINQQRPSPGTTLMMAAVLGYEDPYGLGA